MQELPPCGIYRTREAIGNVPAGRLVYFHDHGDPGPGLYLPSGWQNNRAQWSAQGNLLGDVSNASKLERLPAEGFYSVTETFYCCEKKCRSFEANLFVQLGYNGAAEPILFTPTLDEKGMGLPQNGSRIDADRLTHLRPLRVAQAPKQVSHPPHIH